MNLYKSKTYLEDLDLLIGSTPCFNALRGKTILISGATGLICSAAADLLFRFNETDNAGVKVIAAGRNEDRTRKRFSRYSDEPYFYFLSYDAAKHNVFNFKADYIIHGASNATPADFTAHPIDTMLDNFMALYELLSYAEKTDVSSLLYVSSSEVYGIKKTREPFRESDYGYVDILTARSAYPSAKRASETLCACFSEERGVKTKIVRPGHIYGPTARQRDNRVSSQFAYAAADGQDLVLKSSGSHIRSYCYMLDAASAIFTVLLKGKSAQAYNLSNPDSILSIRQMADYMAKCSGVKTVFAEASQEEKAAFNPMLNSSLNAEKLLSLGWVPLFNAEKGFAHTVKIIREALV